MLDLLLGFILGWSLCGLVWCFVYDKSEKIAIALMGPLVWFIVTILVLLSFIVDFYLKHKYYFVIFGDSETREIRFVNTRNKEDCYKKSTEHRLDNIALLNYKGYILERKMYNGFDYVLAKQFLGISLNHYCMLNKRLVDKIKNELE